MSGSNSQGPTWGLARAPAAAGGESQEIVYTTGNVEAFFLNANTKVGNGSISGHGEAFDCAAWTSQDGAGQLIGTYMVEEDPQAGDAANASLPRPERSANLPSKSQTPTAGRSSASARRRCCRCWPRRSLPRAARRTARCP